MEETAFSGRKARLATIALLIAQLGGCAVDLATLQLVPISAFCLAAPGNGALAAGAFLIWLVLSLSWLVGLWALQFASARPIYWALAILIPFALGAQHWLVDRQILFCDAP